MTQVVEHLTSKHEALSSKSYRQKKDISKEATATRVGAPKLDKEESRPHPRLRESGNELGR
jgi:hypothetical protein